MSQLHPFLRGYRRGLRDVQRAVLLYRKTACAPSSALSALSVAADCISIPLRRLRETGVAALPEQAREQMIVVSGRQLIYSKGYEVGFDDGREIVVGRGRQMNDPDARKAVTDAATNLRQLGSLD